MIRNKKIIFSILSVCFVLFSTTQQGLSSTNIPLETDNLESKAQWTQITVKLFKKDIKTFSEGLSKSAREGLKRNTKPNTQDTSMQDMQMLSTPQSLTQNTQSLDTTQSSIQDTQTREIKEKSEKSMYQYKKFDDGKEVIIRSSIKRVSEPMRNLVSVALEENESKESLIADGGVVLVPCKDDRKLVFLFGFTGRHLIDKTKCESDFGLRVSASATNPDKLKRVSQSKALENNRRTKTISFETETHMGDTLSPTETLQKMEGFVLPEGEPRYTLSGYKGSVTIKKRISWSQFSTEAEKVMSFYNSDEGRKKYPQYFERIEIYDKSKIIELEKSLQLSIRNSKGKPGNSWFISPQGQLEFSNEELNITYQVNGMLCPSPQAVEDEILKVIQLDLDKPDLLKILKRSKISLQATGTQEEVEEEDDENAEEQTFYDWLVFEKKEKDKLFFLEGGAWYQYKEEFIKKLHTFINKLKISAQDNLQLPIFEATDEKEEGYSQRVVDDCPGFLLFDQRKVYVDVEGKDGRSKCFEVCDLLSSEKDLIHIKIGNKFSSLSYLFSQGSTSFTALQKLENRARAVLTYIYRDLISIYRDLYKESNNDDEVNNLSDLGALLLEKYKELIKQEKIDYKKAVKELVQLCENHMGNKLSENPTLYKRVEGYMDTVLKDVVSEEFKSQDWRVVYGIVLEHLFDKSNSLSDLIPFASRVALYTQAKTIQEQLKGRVGVKFIGADEERIRQKKDKRKDKDDLEGESTPKKQKTTPKKSNLEKETSTSPNFQSSQSTSGYQSPQQTKSTTSQQGQVQSDVGQSDQTQKGPKKGDIRYYFTSPPQEESDDASE